LMYPATPLKCKCGGKRFHTAHCTSVLTDTRKE